MTEKQYVVMKVEKSASYYWRDYGWTTDRLEAKRFSGDVASAMVAMACEISGTQSKYHAVVAEFDPV